MSINSATANFGLPFEWSSTGSCSPHGCTEKCACSFGSCGTFGWLRMIKNIFSKITLPKGHAKPRV